MAFDLTSVLDRLGEFASSGVVGVGASILLLLVLLPLMPQSERFKLRMPALWVGLHLILVTIRMLLPADAWASSVLSIVALFFLLSALGRTAFLLVVEVVIGIHLGRPLPKIIHDIVQGIVFAVVIAIVLRAAGVDPGSLLTTSALLTAVVGLALQDTLGNLVSGLSIQVQQPFHVGDWIQIDADSRLIGRVTEINWRAIRVVTTELIELTIPNGAIAKATIRNYTQPTPLSRRTIDVNGPYDVPPQEIHEALLQAVRDVPGILLDPPPFVLIPKFAESGILYQLCYFIDDFSLRDRIDTTVRQRIWHAFRRARVHIPYNVQTLHMYESTDESRRREHKAEAELRIKSFTAVDFLATLTPSLLEKLAERSQTKSYAASEVIVRQGEVGDDFFIIQEGDVSVSVGRAGGSTVQIARLSTDACFGEMSILTGEPRAATVQAITSCKVVSVDKRSFHDVLIGEPDVMARLTEVLVERQNAIEERLSAKKKTPELEQKQVALLSKIRAFFSLHL